MKMFNRLQDVTEEANNPHFLCSLIKSHFNHFNCSKCGLTTALIKRQRSHCHISFPDKAIGNCYVKKIMLTLRIILSLSGCFFFSQRLLSRERKEKKKERELGETNIWLLLSPP